MPSHPVWRGWEDAEAVAAAAQTGGRGAAESALGRAGRCGAREGPGREPQHPPRHARAPSSAPRAGPGGALRFPLQAGADRRRQRGQDVPGAAFQDRGLRRAPGQHHRRGLHHEEPGDPGQAGQGGGTKRRSVCERVQAKAAGLEQSPLPPSQVCRKGGFFLLPFPPTGPTGNRCVEDTTAGVGWTLEVGG